MVGEVRTLPTARRPPSRLRPLLRRLATVVAIVAVAVGLALVFSDARACTQPRRAHRAAQDHLEALVRAQGPDGSWSEVRVADFLGAAELVALVVAQDPDCFSAADRAEAEQDYRAWKRVWQRWEER